MDGFWKKVDKAGDCWIWQGNWFIRGYGALRVNGKQVYAHRVAWELTYGLIPAGLNVCHHCDNPPCVRPDHLFIGTQSDNLHDAINKGRLNNSGENHGMSILTTAQVREIRKIYALKGSRYTYDISQYKLANQYHVARTTIQAIVEGKNWKGVMS